jgi:hypothetical protein
MKSWQLAARAAASMSARGTGSLRPSANATLSSGDSTAPSAMFSAIVPEKSTGCWPTKPICERHQLTLSDASGTPSIVISPLTGS